MFKHTFLLASIEELNKYMTNARKKLHATMLHMIQIRHARSFQKFKKVKYKKLKFAKSPQHTIQLVNPKN